MVSTIGLGGIVTLLIAPKPVLLVVGILTFLSI